jgi:hypothetical protein
MPDSITPALTADQWRHAGSAREIHVYEAGIVHVMAGRVPGVVGENAVALALPDDRHGLAALCLYRQPFGFTWEDVEFLGMMAQASDPMFGNFARSLADRIAALLPPRQG